MTFHLKDFPRLVRPFFKLTKDSKTPTDLELDELKTQLAFLFPTVRFLFQKIVREELSRFVKYRWKKAVGWTLAITSLIIVAYFAGRWFIEPVIIRHTSTKVTETVYIREMRPFKQFVKDVAQRESSGRYNITNQFGMLGAFQFSPSTLKNYVGIDISAEDFLNNPELQIGAFRQLLLNNHRSYKKYVDAWNFKKMKNIKGTVTESGILMAFHLRPESAIAFFNSGGKDLGKPDGNGIYVNHYIELFNGYELPF